MGIVRELYERSHFKYSVKYWLFNFCGIIKVIEAA